MKLFMASAATETNTFAAMPTGLAAFEEFGIFRGDGSANPDRCLFGALFAAWRAMAEADGIEVSESLCVFAQPAGRTLASVWAGFRDAILEDAAAAGPLDIVLLSLHGAMMAEGQDDCEGELLTRLRAIVGPKCRIGVIVDLHCHITEAMLTGADVLIAYKEYPHTDVGERGLELYRLCVAAARGEIDPVTRAFDCAMIEVWRTTVEPGRSLVSLMKDMEARPGVLSVSFGHGFPWADLPDVGAKTWAITNADAELASETAHALALAVLKTAGQGRGEAFLTPEQALERTLQAPAGTVVWADTADNAGGGAPSDSTFVLASLLRAGAQDAALAAIWDMQAVEICKNAEVGSRLALRIGGKCGPTSGDPLDVEATIRSMIFDHVQSGLGDRPSPLGDTVWLEIGGVDVILSSRRAQMFSPAVFTDHGIDLTKRRIVVVKSNEHFRSKFGPLASEILYLVTPGALSPDLGNLPYKHRSPDYFPRVPTRAPQPFPVPQTAQSRAAAS